MDTLVIYHAGCRDGFCAAWVVNKAWDNYLATEHIYGEEHVLTHKITFHPAAYGQNPPDVRDKRVIMVDFAYDLDTMKEIADNCKSLVWLDHHKTALPIYEYFKSLTQYDYVKFVFDINRSGAGIAWDYFFKNHKRPWLVNYVEDRDLWAKKLPKSDEINAYIATLEFNFIRWETASQLSLSLAEEYGQIALAKTEQYVREVCKNVYFINTGYIGNPITEPDVVEEWKNIPTVNICQIDCSEVLHELCKRYPESPFALYWFRRGDGMYQYGLRSIGDFDVSHVAKLFGGGGHKNAAGFQLNFLLEELK